ncbi:MAG TPA: flavin reductase family protein [Candidatus Saccharimonadales bacterium]|nr:flavin reductase family protein [Candidatus Saccharimonadales bacterium]
MAPRLVFLLGTVSEDGERNIMPISSVTSISTDPGMAIVAVYKEWQTCKNLETANGFTLSLAPKEQLELVWKLGGKYSGYRSSMKKVEEFKNSLDFNFSKYGPVLKGALGWIECEVVDRPNAGKGNHLLVTGKYTKAMIDETKYTSEILPIGAPKPLMQWAQNAFSTPDNIFDIPYYEGPRI